MFIVSLEVNVLFIVACPVEMLSHTVVMLRLIAWLWTRAILWHMQNNTVT